MNNYSVLIFKPLLEKFYGYLDGKIAFSPEGWPIFDKSHFLQMIPDMIVPYYQRNNLFGSDKKRTVICFYASDRCILARFCKIFQELPIYKEYMGVVSPDLTVTSDMDDEYKSFIMLLNQLFAAVLAVNGIKLIFNSRCPDDRFDEYYRNIPKHIAIASSSLGCKSAKDPSECCVEIAKFLYMLPSVVFMYGKSDLVFLTQMKLMGMNPIEFADYHSTCKKIRRA